MRTKVLAGAAVVVLLVYVINWITADTVSVERWKLSDGLEIELLADAGWEANRGIYYRVVQRGETIIPITFVDAIEHPGDIRNRYVIAKAEGCPVVAIVDKRDAVVALAVLDTQTKDSWPHRGDTEGWRDARERGRKMTDRLGSMTQPPCRYRLAGE